MKYIENSFVDECFRSFNSRGKMRYFHRSLALNHNYISLSAQEKLCASSVALNEVHKELSQIYLAKNNVNVDILLLLEFEFLNHKLVKEVRCR